MAYERKSREFVDVEMEAVRVKESEDSAHRYGIPPKIDPEQGEIEQYGETKRGLKSRHIQLIALGGCMYS